MLKRADCLSAKLVFRILDAEKIEDELAITIGDC
jgi:hypothetical protein